MPRKARKAASQSNSISYRYVWVSWTHQELVELRKWLDGNQDSVEAALSSMVDSGWKVSLSENQSTGRNLVSITDKAGRQGLAGLTFGLEHNDVGAAIFGAFYYATEIIGDGGEPANQRNMDDLW